MKNHQVTVITAAEFEAVVRQASVPVVVDVFADWCGPCKMLAPFLEKFAAELAGKVKIVKVDFDADRELAKSFGIDSIPRLLFFNAGEVVEHKIGMPEYPDLKTWFQDFLTRVGIAGAEDSEAEAAFVEAVTAAGEALDTAMGPAGEAYGVAVKPFSEKLQAYEAELKGKGVEGDELAAAMKAKQEELWPEIEPAYNQYKAVAGPATQAYIEAVEKAVADFAGSTPVEGDTAGDDDQSGAGKMCAIGDPTCQS
ncbi:MAG: thioredoxin [Cyanobacteria bacterium HKST-UBA02]|nr:thioredoxin [Cyanobacteria bacterium HKST-UBA02]